jgi:hypothetical protein
VIVPESGGSRVVDVVVDGASVVVVVGVSVVGGDDVVVEVDGTVVEVDGSVVEVVVDVVAGGPGGAAHAVTSTPATTPIAAIDARTSALLTCNIPPLTLVRWSPVRLERTLSSDRYGR